MPGPSRPARPALCRAWAWLHSVTASMSSPAPAWCCLAFTLQLSTTCRTPGIVRLVSAILVASTTCSDQSVGEHGRFDDFWFSNFPLR